MLADALFQLIESHMTRTVMGILPCSKYYSSPKTILYHSRDQIWVSQLCLAAGDSVISLSPLITSSPSNFLYAFLILRRLQ